MRFKTAGCAFIRALKIAYERKIGQCHFKFENYYQESTDESTDEKDGICSEMIHNTSTYIDDIAIATRSFKKQIDVLNIIFTLKRTLQDDQKIKRYPKLY